jgi:hypothetical protein
MPDTIKIIATDKTDLLRAMINEAIGARQYEIEYLIAEILPMYEPTRYVSGPTGRAIVSGYIYQ